MPELPFIRYNEIKNKAEYTRYTTFLLYIYINKTTIHKETHAPLEYVRIRQTLDTIIEKIFNFLDSTFSKEVS